MQLTEVVAAVLSAGTAAAGFMGWLVRYLMQSKDQAHAEQLASKDKQIDQLTGSIKALSSQHAETVREMREKHEATVREMSEKLESAAAAAHSVTRELLPVVTLATQAVERSEKVLRESTETLDALEIQGRPSE